VNPGTKNRLARRLGDGAPVGGQLTGIGQNLGGPVLAAAGDTAPRRYNIRYQRAENSFAGPISSRVRGNCNAWKPSQIKI
jgi:hypothetical protein